LTNNNIHNLKGLAAALGVAALMFLPAACTSDKPEYVSRFKDRAAVAGMFSDSVTTLISDSGRIRYRVVTEVWKIYDKAADPYWYFPKKIYFERFNDSLKTESLVQADTARYYTRRKLWVLRKKVKLVNLKGETFETALLYWDQRQQRIYSDSFIRIEQNNQVLTGYGFESNESLTKYNIFKPEGIFPLDSAKPDSLQMDTKAKK
jgi:LPS export ABC transporter protein LptC